MPMQLMVRLTIAAATLLPGPMAWAQSNVNPGQQYAWGENIGWTNWRDNNGTRSGVVIGPEFLSGDLWGENIGFITVGDGLPANGSSYANVDGTDFGVNILPNGDLDGLAWGENVGWVNFGWAANTGNAARARLERTCLNGWVWLENDGWLNLDGLCGCGRGECGTPGCPGDLNQSGVVDAADLAQLLGAWGTPGCGGSMPCCANLNGDGAVNAADLAQLLGAWGVCATLCCGSDPVSENVNAVVEPGMVQCTDPGPPEIVLENSFYRSFSEFDGSGLPPSYQVCGVVLGIQSATDGDANGIVPFEIRLYDTLIEEGPLGVPVGVQVFTVAGDGTADGTVLPFELLRPVTVTTGKLTVEVKFAGGQDSGDALWPGSNNNGQLGPTYIRAPACTLHMPTDMAALGFPQVHIIIQPFGDAGP